MKTIIGINKYVRKDSNKESITIYFEESFPDYCKNAFGHSCGFVSGYNNEFLDMLNVGDSIEDFTYTKPFKSKDGKMYSFINGFVASASK